MFTAVPFKSHVRNGAYEAGSKSAPAPSRRFRPLRKAYTLGSVFMTPRPFLLDQNPRVRPPPAPRQTLPNCTSLVSPAARVTGTEVAVVWIQFVSTGLLSLTT